MAQRARGPMNAIELVQYTSDVIFAVIFVVVLARALRYRRRANVDAALLFGALTFVIGAGLITRALGISGTTFGLVTAAVLLALPLLTLRLVDELVPLRSIVLRAAFVGWLISSLAFALASRELLLTIAVPVLLYFVGFEAYAGFVVLRASRTSRGVVRPRLIAIGAGTLFLGAAILVLVFAMAVPGITVATNVFGLCCALAYFAGFSTPTPLRRAWQEPLLREFIQTAFRTGSDVATPPLMRSIVQAVARVVGSDVVAVGIWDEPKQEFLFHTDDGRMVEAAPEETVSAPAFEGQKAILRIEGDGGPPFPPKIRELGMRAALAAPVTWGTTRYGVLGAFAKRAPLFAEDDLALLEILAGHVALILRNNDLFGEVRALNSELEHRISELDAANDELSSFAYAVSHDLRAPLRAIDGFSGVLVEEKSEALGADGRQHLGRVRAAAQRMGELIDDLLDLSRMSRAELRRQPVDLSELARSVGADHAARSPERTVAFRVEEGLRVDGDDRLLRVALDNLIGNAWKFTRPVKEARVEVGVSGENGARAYYVRDNGVGFEMEYKQKLFTPFQRLHSPRDFEGTGVGLATVRRVVRRHGGDVWAESEPGRGTTFYFTLSDG